MKRLLAQQLVYGRVEVDYCRTGRGGLQTLWRSKALTATTVREIEPIIRCFDTASEQRLQFVRLSDGRFLVSQTHLSSGEVVDRDGRQTFICRALVVDRGVFHEFGENPLRINAANPFVYDVAELLDSYGKPPAEIQPLVLAGPGEARAGSPQLTRQAAEALVRCALFAREMRSAGELAVLRGSPRAAEEVLGWLFDQTPVRLRQWCSFTTQTDRCTPSSGVFCFVAGTSRPAGHRHLEVQLDAMKLKTSRKIHLEGAGEMLVRLLVARDFRLRPDDLESADAICLLLNGSTPAKLSEVDSGILAELLEQKPETAANRIERAVRPRLGRQAVALTNWMKAHWGCVPASAILRLLQGSDPIAEDPDLLLDLIEPWMAVSEPRFSWWRRRKLTRLAACRSRRVLAQWLSRGSMSRWRFENLEEMTDKEFEHACIKLGTMPPAEFVCQRHLSKLLQDQRAVEVDDLQFVSLLDRAESIGADLDTTSLRDRVARLRPSSLNRLVRLTKQRPRLKQLLPMGSSN